VLSWGRLYSLISMWKMNLMLTLVGISSDDSSHGVRRMRELDDSEVPKLSIDFN
jgi:hypothetical protein